MENATIDSPSADPREVARFSDLADTWWDADGPFWPLHTLNRLRIDWIEQSLTELDINGCPGKPLAGLRVLDVGCGGGILSESLVRRGAQVLGIDVVERNIGIARAHGRSLSAGLTYRLLPVEQLAESGEVFDVVFNMEVVEHVADLGGFMEACNALVKPGGAMFVATINRNLLAWLVTVLGAEYVLRWLPRGTHRYRMLRKPGEIVDSLTHDGLVVEKRAGVAVNPLTRRMSLTGHTLINYMLCARRPA